MVQAITQRLAELGISQQLEKGSAQFPLMGSTVHQGPLAAQACVPQRQGVAGEEEGRWHAGSWQQAAHCHQSLRARGAACCSQRPCTTGSLCSLPRTSGRTGWPGRHGSSREGAQVSAFQPKASILSLSLVDDSTRYEKNVLLILPAGFEPALPHSKCTSSSSSATAG